MSTAQTVLQSNDLNWKGCGRKWSWHNFKVLTWHWKNHKGPQSGQLGPRQNSNWTPPKYKYMSGALPLESTCPVLLMSVVLQLFLSQTEE
jgi:hypothetical protein